MMASALSLAATINGRLAQPFDIGLGGGAHRHGQGLCRLLQEAFEADRGLGDDVHRSGGHGLQRGFRAFLCQGRADDYRGRVFGHDLGEEGDAIHAWHLHIQHYHVGPLLFQFFQCKQRIRGGGYHLDVRFLFENGL